MKNRELVEYIRLSLAQGKVKEEIYKELLNQGVGIDAIQDAFNQIVTKEEKEEAREKTIRIVVTIGAILVGFGFFSFIASNWQEMTKGAKVLIIVTTMTSSYIFGWFFREKWHYEKIGEALILLGTILYGAGIFLIAQIFHIRENWPDGFILWMIGIIVMALGAESFSLFYLTIPVGIAAIIGYLFVIFRTLSVYNQFLLTSSVLLLIATIVTFITGWLVKKSMPPELKEFY